MDIEYLRHMANQIAANMAQEPDPAAATAQHIQLYWDPRMKAAILADDGAAQTPQARAVIEWLRSDAEG